MDKTTSQRLFFALWPEPELANTIWQATTKLVPKGLGRRLPPHHLHLTLAFLGSISQEQQDCMVRAVEQIQSEPFTLVLDKPGHFPRPQVVWCGIQHIPDQLKILQLKLVSKLTQICDYQPESRPFLPHMTLWRKIRQCDLPKSIDLIQWKVNRFVLARSLTMPKGAEYSIVREWPLLSTQL